MVHYLNFVQFYLKKVLFWAKKWRSIQNVVLIESGVLLPRIRYSRPAEGCDGSKSDFIAESLSQMTLSILKVILQIDSFTSLSNLSQMTKGAFNIYVNRILTFFDHLPTPSKQTY